MKYTKKKISENGGVTMDNKKYNSLDLNKLRNREPNIVSSREALKDVTPIKWSEDTLSGKQKIIISCNK